MQVVVVGEQFEHRLVGGPDVLRVPRERRPTERALPLAEEGPDVEGHETLDLEGPAEPALAGLVADRVAVVEDLGTGVLEGDHRLDVLGHRGLRPARELLGLGRRVVGPLRQLDPLGEVGERVVGARLVGDDVDGESPAHELGQHGRAIADEADRSAEALGLRRLAPGDGVVEVVGHLVQVPVLDPALQPLGIDVDDQAHALVQGDGERLCTSHPPAAAGHRQGAGQRAAEALGGHRSEGLVGALQDALGPDVDPRPGCHLAVHGEAEGLEAAELGPGGPVPDEVGVGDDDSGCPLMGPHDADRLAGLHQHRLVVAERGQRAHHGVERSPAARRPSGAAVDDEVVGPLGHLGVEVVHQHPQRGLGLPRPGGEPQTAWRPHGTSTFHDPVLSRVGRTQPLHPVRWYS